MSSAGQRARFPRASAISSVLGYWLQGMRCRPYGPWPTISRFTGTQLPEPIACSWRRELWRHRAGAAASCEPYRSWKEKAVSLFLAAWISPAEILIRHCCLISEPRWTGPLTRPRLYGAAATEPLLDSWARSSIEDEVLRPCSITITNGAVDAVERLLTAHLTRGDAVAIEDPCFLASIGTLKANSFRAVPMDIDTSGITPQGLLRALESGVRAIICTPRAHNPTGVSMSADRAAILGSILAEFPHVLVIEDDHFSAVSSNRYCRLAPMSTTRWALVRSVSKFLGPDLRVAVVASDLDTGIRLSTHLRSGANWVSHLQQRLSAELLSDPTVIDGLANARAVYERRRTLLKSALSEHDIEVPDTFDGLNVWVPLDRDSEPIVERLAESGWLVRDGSQFSATPGQCHRALRVTASTITSDQAREFASALAEILASP